MMAIQRAPERDFRGPGCTDACRVIRAVIQGQWGRTELLLHDPEAHERYGRTLGAPSLVVRTGGLKIDLGRRRVHVYGRYVACVGREWDILDTLARSPGRWFRTVELVEAVWGPAWAAMPNAGHIVRVNVCRLRGRLTPIGSLIESRLTHGYRLMQADPIVADQDGEEAPPVRRWAPRLGRDACIDCGTDRLPHHANGRCAGCDDRARRRGRAS